MLPEDMWIDDLVRRGVAGMGMRNGNVDDLGHAISTALANCPQLGAKARARLDMARSEHSTERIAGLFWGFALYAA